MSVISIVAEVIEERALGWLRIIVSGRPAGRIVDHGLCDGAEESRNEKNQKKENPLYKFALAKGTVFLQ